jgi:putative oxidoreductase
MKANFRRAVNSQAEEPALFQKTNSGGRMKSSTKVILRSLLGLIFLVFGLNKFFHFIPNPPEAPAAMNLFIALFKTGYFFPLLATTEVTTSVLLLSGFMVPFALILIAPVIVNIFMFHFFLAPGGLPLVAILIALEIALAWMHRDAYAPLFSGSHPMPVRASMGAEVHA